MEINSIFSTAYQWLCKNRKHHPPSSDIWDFRRFWKKKEKDIIDTFSSGEYRFESQKKITLASGETIALWSSCDALVLKVLTWIIQEKLKPYLSKCCFHLKGHGGLKGAVKKVLGNYPKYPFFFKTDVHSYYDSIDHYTLIMRLSTYITDSMIIHYVWQFLKRCVEWGGLYQDVTKGISRGSSLSPLLGALYLLEFDQRMEELNVRYFRYMDDILILASSRWKLRKAIRILNQTFAELKLEKHPAKTLIGKTNQGFDFLGYRFEPQGLCLASKTIADFMSKALRLYEQEPSYIKDRRIG